METIHKILQESVQGDFWRFVGYYAIIYLLCETLYKSMYYFVRGLILLLKYRKNGK